MNISNVHPVIQADITGQLCIMLSTGIKIKKQY